MRLAQDKNTSVRREDQTIGSIVIEETVAQSGNNGSSRTKNNAYKMTSFGQILLEQDAAGREGADFVPSRFEKRPRLGHILVRSGVLSEDMLQGALEYQRKTGVRLGEALVELNFLSEEAMRQTLCTQLNIPFIGFEHISVDRSLSRLINKNYAKRHRIVPTAKIGNTVTLVMDDPTDRDLIDELEAFTGLTINIVTSTRAAIVDVFNRLYNDAAVTEVDLGMQIVDEDAAEAERISKYLESQQCTRADAIVTQLISIALRNGASDIHLETTDRRVLTRFRIDGVLQELYLGSLEDEINRLRKEVVSRIKILGKLDIAERRRPQDGSFRARIVKEGQEVKVDFRISVVAGYYGENVVLRILDSRQAPKSIDELGFSEKINHTLHRLLKRNTGILLATGPTGSGKSTTLYGGIMTCYRPGIKILTAEDPIEYVYDKITQCEVNPKIGNTFAKFVRAFLRQDPEVIMVGEVRDTETAEMAFRAAQTGHLVLSTLHTNDAVSSVTRLLGLEVDPSLIASCLLGVLSQRLVRQICSHCKMEYVPDRELVGEFFNGSRPRIRWFKGRGCSKCNHTGYSGRTAVAELWTPSDKDIILINKGAGIDELRRSSYASTIFMAEDAMQKLSQGKTNLEELIRTLPCSSIEAFRRFVDSPRMAMGYKTPPVW